MTIFRGSGTTGSGGIAAEQAENISIDDDGSLYVAVNVEDALQEVRTVLNADKADLANHLADTTDAHDASAISYVNTTSGLTATEVQSAIDENDANIDAHIADTTAAHAATAISIVDSGTYFTGTEVETALQEIGLSLTTVGLQYFTEGRNTSSPNATVPVHSFTASGAESNIDWAGVPKGTGAFLAQIPDGTVAGGNKRGDYAVDFQRLRTSADEVASGDYSFCMGYGNTVSGSYSASFGQGNEVSGEINFAANNSNTVTGSYSFAFGWSNRNTGVASSSGGGLNNWVNGDFSGIFAGRDATDRGLYGRIAFASGDFSTRGDAQEGKHILRRETTDATPTILTSDSLTPSSTNVPVLPDDHAYIITADITGFDSATGDVYHVIAQGTATRGTGAATSALVGTPAYTTISKSAGASTWAVALVANTTRGSAEIQVTGAAATTIHWVAKFETVEVG